MYHNNIGHMICNMKVVIIREMKSSTEASFFLVDHYKFIVPCGGYISVTMYLLLPCTTWPCLIHRSEP